MNDRFNDTSPPDASRISLQEQREVRYWTSRLGISLNQLRQAIDAVGASPVHVEAWVKYQAQIVAWDKRRDVVFPDLSVPMSPDRIH